VRRSRWLFAVGTVVLALLPIGAAGTARAQEASPTPSPSPVGVGECVTCHGVPEIVAASGTYRPDLLVRPTDVQSSVHADFTCTTCHSALLNTMHARRDRARESCATCHAAEKDALEVGYHGEQGRDQAHLHHVSRLAWRQGRGHAGLRAPRERPVRSVSRADERAVPRGQRVRHGDAPRRPRGRHVRRLPRLPHGPAEDDPRSPVNEQNLLTTCRQCHENAPANFVEVQMHLGEGPIPEDPRLRWATIYMLTLLISTFGFFGYLTILGIRHEWRHVGPRTAG
jgi:cytochrome c553